MREIALRPRPDLPAIPVDDWQFPVADRTVLAQGLDLVSIHTPGKPLVAARLVIGAPLATERRDGVYSLASGLWTNGPADLDPLAFAMLVEGVGASMSAGADHTGMAISFDVAATRLHDALSAIGRVLADPGYRDDALEIALQGAAAGHEEMLVHPDSRAEFELAQAMFAPDSRACRPVQGSPDSLAGVDRDELVAVHRSMVVPGAASLVLVGDLEGLDIADLVASAWNGWTGDRDRSSDDLSLQPGSGGHHLVTRDDAVQTSLRWGVCLSGADVSTWSALGVATFALGGSMRSRLMKALREDHGFTYGVTASSRRWNATDGVLAISTAVDGAVTAQAVAETERILAEVLDDGFAEDEIDACVRHLLGAAPVALQTNGGVADALARVMARGGDASDLDRERRALGAVTADDATSALRDALADASLTTVAVGPSHALSDVVRRELG